MTKPRVRFAPSPTGYLHVGGARTALFNWLYARHSGGTFVLRIEDTDQNRNSQAAVDVILEGMRWLGLDWDEGPLSGDAGGASRGEFGPYFQSCRGSVYARRITELRDRGCVYERDGALMFRMSREPVVIRDLIVGDVRRELTDRELEDPDFVVVRSDGQPVFHLVNVIDDLEMQISHVIRGEDHLSNTAKHICLFRAFGVEPPAYAHIPLILNPDGSKMSKRDRGASVQGYQVEGFVPEALVNYLSLLGWTPASGNEVFSMADAATQFELSEVHRSNARYDLRKLEHFQFEHVRRMAPDRFVGLGREVLARKGINLDAFPADYVRDALLSVQEKGKLLSELLGWVDFYFHADDAVRIEPEAAAKALTPEGRAMAGKLASRFAAREDFGAAALEADLKALAAELGVKAGTLVQPCRVACTGRLVGPSLYHLMEILGRERVLSRLRRAAG